MGVQNFLFRDMPNSHIKRGQVEVSNESSRRRACPTKFNRAFRNEAGKTYVANLTVRHRENKKIADSELLERAFIDEHEMATTKKYAGL